MTVSDRISGSMLLAIGLLAAYGGSRLPPVPGQQIGPNVFPIVIGAALAFCGVMVALGIGRRLEDEAEADLAAVSGVNPSEAPRSSGWLGLRTLVPPALLVFYALGVERLGFFLTAAMMAAGLSIALGGRWRVVASVALLAPVAVHLVFAKLLRVPLPDGLIPMPW